MVRESDDPTAPAAAMAGLSAGGKAGGDLLARETVDYAENLTRPGFLVFDGQGKLHCANMQAYTIFGRKPGDAELAQRDRFFHALGVMAGDTARVEAQCAAAAGGFDRFFTVALLDGRQLGVSTDQLCSSDGGEPGAAWIVSELADKTWRTVDARVIGPITRAAMAATPDGMLIADTEGRVIAMNHTFATMWDIGQEEIVGRPRAELLGRFARKLRDPEPFILQTKEYHRNPSSQGVGMFELLDGRFLERYTAPLLTRGGEIIGRIVFYRDVTQRMETAGKLAASTAQLRNALDQARVAPWEYDFTTDTFILTGC